MTPERWGLIKSVLQRSLDTPANSRAAFLVEVCGADHELRAEVESLLAAHIDSGDFLQESINIADVLPPESPAPGDVLGVYQIVQKIGEGGMSSVYQAVRDDDQFRRLVAVKVLKRGMDTDFLVHRFRKERQILAHFDHPNIARIFDGGSTPDGRPYFVMEYIAGKTIDAYCDEHKLSVRARLELFLKICSAVEYAHQNLVVHRDLKPSNILVTAEGEPKLLDFGIAKLLEDERDITASYLRLMTPDYASPEQVDGAPITTRSDVYSLGVILFELLTGQRPYKVSGRSLREAANSVAKDEAPKPSTTIGRAAESIADLRSTRRDRLRKQLEDDVDNIVAMAMRKETNERYASVGQLAADIRRHFAGEPIVARRDSVGYRIRKFILRHRTGVAATAAVIVALAVGIVLALYSAHVADQQRALAERRFDLVRNLASTVLGEVHDAIAPLAGSTAARELIVRRAQEYLDNLEAESSGSISLQRERADLYIRVGDVLGNPALPNLGNIKSALENYRHALNLNRQLALANPKDERTQAALATAHQRVCAMEDRLGDFKTAVESCTESVRLNEQIASIRRTDKQARADLGLAYESLAEPYFSLGDWDRAREFRSKALGTFEQLAKAEPGNEFWATKIANAHHVLAAVEEQSKHFGLARKNAELAVAGFQARADAHPGDPAAQLQPTFALQRLGSILLGMGDPYGALNAFERALPVRQQQSALDPKDARARLNLLRSHNSIGYTLVKLDQPERALEHFKVEEQLARELVQRDPAALEHQTSLLNANEDLGLLWKYYAEHARPSAQRPYWQQAKAYFAKALEIADTLQARQAVPASYTMVHERLKTELTTCERALTSKLARN